MEIPIRPQDVEQVVESVFSTMLGIGVEPGAARPRPSTEDCMAAAIHLSGTWNGSVVLHCGPQQARHFAGRFLGEEQPISDEGEVRDVLGELANMIAGNLKCTLCPGVHLSVPSVAGCGEQRLEPPGQGAYCSDFETGVGPFWLSMLIG